MIDMVQNQVSRLTTVELIVNMHCEACAKQLKKKSSTNERYTNVFFNIILASQILSTRIQNFKLVDVKCHDKYNLVSTILHLSDPKFSKNPWYVGVRTAETYLSLGKVIVPGSINANKLVDYVYRRTKKQAKVVLQPEPWKPTEEPKSEDPNSNRGEEAKKLEEEEKNKDRKDGKKASEGEEEIINKMMYYSQPLYVIE
ncbi:hypothetical protein CQW23_15576 [Capsicum baccatum]|uniref:HMA domain-containing protein n=1 Tax=Capsicum baccatum TaxID=33114 RepID=A0A2G2WMF9_CAPBA|nr:hypothetical protein CQW23_15576 [Capsicum baccatum]